MKKILTVLILSCVLFSCTKTTTTHQVNYLEEPLPNDFSTVVRKHHDTLASRLETFANSIYGISKKTSTIDTSVDIDGDGIEMSMTVGSSGETDFAEDKTKFRHIYTMNLLGDTPTFPTLLDISASGKIDTFQEAYDTYIYLEDTFLEMKNQKDISSQLLSMVKLFEKQWIYLTPEDAGVFDPQGVTKKRDISGLYREITTILKEEKLFSLVENAESEDDDFYVYKIRLEPEPIKNILNIISGTDIPFDSEVIQFLESEDVSGWFRMHKQSPEIWSLDIIDAWGGSLTIEETERGYGFEFVDLSQDNSINFFVNRGDTNNGTLKVTDSGKEIFEAEISYTFAPEAQDIEIGLSFYDVAAHTNPIYVHIQREAQHVESTNLNLTAPTDYIDAKELGLGEATTSSDIQIQETSSEEDVDWESQ